MCTARIFESCHTSEAHKTSHVAHNTILQTAEQGGGVTAEEREGIASRGKGLGEWDVGEEEEEARDQDEVHILKSKLATKWTCKGTTALTFEGYGD